MKEELTQPGSIRGNGERVSEGLKQILTSWATAEEQTADPQEADLRQACLPPGQTGGTYLVGVEVGIDPAIIWRQGLSFSFFCHLFICIFLSDKIWIISVRD